MIPKYYLFYYKNLLDIAFSKFFELYNDDFIKDEDSYILAKSFDYSKIKRIFKALIKQTISEIITPYNILEPKYYLIIGSCIPKENLLLKAKDNTYFPAKLDKLINLDYTIKYILKEKDIKIDLVKFNTVCLEIFNDLFKKTNTGNIIYIQHKKLDCYTMFKTLKSIFGKANCINLYAEKYQNLNSPIIAVNDLIDKYVHNKLSITKTKEFKDIYNDIKQFVQNKKLI